MGIETFPFSLVELLDSLDAQAALLSEIMAEGDAAATVGALAPSPGPRR